MEPEEQPRFDVPGCDFALWKSYASAEASASLRIPGNRCHT